VFLKHGYRAMNQVKMHHDLETRERGGFVPAIQISGNYLRLGNKSEAYRWLETAVSSIASSPAK
jgi:hypothetical protein